MQVMTNSAMNSTKILTACRKVRLKGYSAIA
jgi:hypothetical protein